jgi:hypothetical protein
LLRSPAHADIPRGRGQPACDTVERFADHPFKASRVFRRPRAHDPLRRLDLFDHTTIAKIVGGGLCRRGRPGLVRAGLPRDPVGAGRELSHRVAQRILALHQSWSTLVLFGRGHRLESGDIVRDLTLLRAKTGRLPRQSLNRLSFGCALRALDALCRLAQPIECRASLLRCAGRGLMHRIGGFLKPARGFGQFRGVLVAREALELSCLLFDLSRQIPLRAT